MRYDLGIPLYYSGQSYLFLKTLPWLRNIWWLCHAILLSHLASESLMFLISLLYLYDILKCQTRPDTAFLLVDSGFWQAITALKKGAYLLKYGRRGKPKFCPFRLSNVRLFPLRNFVFLKFFLIVSLVRSVLCFYRTSLYWYGFQGKRRSI